jgi:hypothetical protein
MFTIDLFDNVPQIHWIQMWSFKYCDIMKHNKTYKEHTEGHVGHVKVTRSLIYVIYGRWLFIYTTTNCVYII